MRIVASLTTIPSRINLLEPTLKSISNQTQRPDVIYLCVPEYCKKEQREYQIPAFVHRYATVIPLNKDYGPLCKLVGPLQIEQDPDTRIITIDDDILYSPKLMQTLQQSQPTKSAAVGMSGFRIGRFPFYLNIVANYGTPPPWWFNSTPNPDGSTVDILAGYAGCMYKRGFFPRNVEQLTIHVEDPDIYKNDDVLISSWLSSQGIPRYVYPGPPEKCREVCYRGGLSNARYSFVRSAYKAIKRCAERGLLRERVTVRWCWTLSGPILLLAALVLIFVFLLLLRK